VRLTFSLTPKGDFSRVLRQINNVLSTQQLKKDILENAIIYNRDYNGKWY
jgi:hypothetical protein